MSPRRWSDRLQDIVDAIEEIQFFTQNMDLMAFEEDSKTIRAVELDFIIIGEAANAISDEIAGQYPQIPWSMMRSMRNRLVHVYFSIAPSILWVTIQKDLPAVSGLIRNLLKELDASGFS